MQTHSRETTARHTFSGNNATLRKVNKNVCICLRSKFSIFVDGVTNIRNENF